MVSSVAFVAGTIGSAALTLYTGRHSPPLLMVLMAGWVVGPFLGLALWMRLAPSRPALLTTGRALLTICAMASVAIYADGAFQPRATTPTFLFVLTPACQWVASVIALTVAAVRTTGR
jgi:hypothetical protein